MSADFNVQTFKIPVSRRLRWLMLKARVRRWWQFRQIPKQERELLLKIEARIQSDLDHLIIFGALPPTTWVFPDLTHGLADLSDQDEDASR
jgi:hypothetical protein